MIIMRNSITFACIILVSPSSTNAYGAAAASFATNHLYKTVASCADNQSSLTVAWSSSRSTRSAISSSRMTIKKGPILSLSALSNDVDGNSKKKQQQQSGFRQIGGPIQPSVANQYSKDDIVTLLRNRTKARRDRNFSRADEILQTLSDTGVFVNDSRKVWRADGFFSVTVDDDEDVDGAVGAGNTDYVKSKKSKYMNDDDTKHVLKRLEQRTQAKHDKDYMTADTIRDELRYLFHIEVNDALKTWSVLGEEKSLFLKGDYVFGGKRVANIPEDDLNAIEDLIKQRVEAKKRKDYVVADAILADLKVRYSVRVDDKKKQWHLSPV